jgi:hypothetical protein
MSIADIPSPIAEFFRILEARDASAIAEALGREVVVEEMGRVYRGSEAITRWSVEQATVDRARRVLHGEAQRARVVVSTLPRTNTTSATAHTRWSFAMIGNEIATVTVVDEAGPALADPVATFVRATNLARIEALLTTFADGALVNDQLHEYWGASAIAEWASREVIAQRLSLLVCRVKVNREQIVVTASVDGIFERRGLPDPLFVTFYFSTSRGKIAQLLILPNESAP